MLAKSDLVDRAQVRVTDLSSGVALHNRGIDVELLREILIELRRLNEREESPGLWRRMVNRLRRQENHKRFITRKYIFGFGW